jgi:hypothetical protein
MDGKGIMEQIRDAKHVGMYGSLTEALLKDIINELSSKTTNGGQNIVILSGRRYGKTLASISSSWFFSDEPQDNIIGRSGIKASEFREIFARRTDKIMTYLSEIFYDMDEKSLATMVLTIESQPIEVINKISPIFEALVNGVREELEFDQMEIEEMEKNQPKSKDVWIEGKDVRVSSVKEFEWQRKRGSGRKSFDVNKQEQRNRARNFKKF